MTEAIPFGESILKRRPAKNTDAKQFVKTTRLWTLLALTLVAGCAAPAGRLQITAMSSESLKTNPKAYQRLAIVPIWFTTSAFSYSGLTSGKLMQIARTAGQQTAVVLAATITNRGFQVVGAARTVCCEEDLASYDAETRQLLDEVRVEFWALTQMAQAAASAGTLDQPFKYKLKAPLLQLQKKLNVPQADALVLMDSTVVVETPAGRWKRLLWNWTGAPLVTNAVQATEVAGAGNRGNAPAELAAVSCPACIEQTITIVDPRTQDVLLWTSVLTPDADVRDPVDLRVALFDLLSALPLIEPPSRGP